MTPTPQDHAVPQEGVVTPVVGGDRIVISGMSGLYPKSHNVEELSRILYNKKLQLMLSEGIANGSVRPLSRVTYAPLEAPRAFRLMAASHHRGRVLLRMKDNTPRAQSNRLSCNPDMCQLIVCDQEEFGLQLADRLVDRGAKKLHIHYMFHSTTKLQFKMRSWQRSGVQVQVSSVSLDSADNVTDLLNDAERLGSLQGIYSVVGARQDNHESLFADLDSVSRKLCPNLRYFAVINMDDTMSGHSTGISRVRSKLPSTMLPLSKLNQTLDCSRSVKEQLVRVDGSRSR